MREYMGHKGLLAALKGGGTLVGHPRSMYPGERVAYEPRVDEVNGHPDFYPWRVVGRSGDHRLPGSQVRVL